MRTSPAALQLWALLALAVLLTGCGKSPDPGSHYTPTNELFAGLELLVMGGTNEAAMAQSAHHALALRPHFLALLHVENEAQLKAFDHRLRQQGLTYPFTHFVPASSGEDHMALLSMQRAQRGKQHTNLTYTSEGETHPVSRPFTELHFHPPDGPPLILLLAHLKSTEFHPANQYEMRRNEARLLSKLTHSLLKEHPDSEVLLAGLLQDDPDSANLKTLCKDALVDLRPADAAGAVWTSMDTGKDLYRRTDYLLASTNLAQRLAEGAAFINTPLDIQWSLPHRPLAVELFPAVKPE